MPRLGDVGEHAWIAALLRRLPRAERRRGVLLGAGDDAAVVRTRARPLLLTTDCLIEEVHPLSKSFLEKVKALLAS